MVGHSPNPQSDVGKVWGEWVSEVYWQLKCNV